LLIERPSSRLSSRQTRLHKSNASSQSSIPTRGRIVHSCGRNGISRCAVVKLAQYSDKQIDRARWKQVKFSRIEVNNSERSDDGSVSISLRAGLIEPSDPSYDAARKVYNGMMDWRPRLIANCTGVADIMTVVKFGREQNLLVAIRGGGHNASRRDECSVDYIALLRSECLS
jgi:hypothetical protein